MFQHQGQEQELTQSQKIGIRDYKLILDQVKTPNFGEHTLVAINKIEQFYGITDKQVAFKMVEGLNFHQSRGVSEFYLTRGDVHTPNFGRHTIDALDELRKRRVRRGGFAGPGHDRPAFLNRLEGLNEIQTRGVIERDLSKAQVQTPNFGEHTLRYMGALIIHEERENNLVIDDQAAFEMVSELDEHQARGVFEYRLEKDQVQSPNFGWHTLAAINDLKELGFDDQTAFNKVKGLNKAQIRGVFYFKLSPDDVQAPNFGEHTLKTIRILTIEDPTLTYEEAFKKVKGLNEAQAEGISEYLLTRDQVENKFYNEKILDTMRHLHRQFPDAEVKGVDLYKFAIKLPDYQSRGILQYGLTLEQVGIGISEDKFIIQEPTDPNFSGETVDAIELLRSKNSEMSFQDAYDIAIELGSNQIRGMIDYGLTLEQVNSQLFMDSGNAILEELVKGLLEKTIEEENMGIDLLLSKEQQEVVRVEFNKIARNEEDHDIVAHQEVLDDTLASELATLSINDADSSDYLKEFSTARNLAMADSKKSGRSEGDDTKPQAKAKKPNKKRVPNC